MDIPWPIGVKMGGICLEGTPVGNSQGGFSAAPQSNSGVICIVLPVRTESVRVILRRPNVCSACPQRMVSFTENCTLLSSE